MLTKQENLLHELRRLAQEHCRDNVADEDAVKATAPFMTWVTTLAALDDAREAIDDLIDGGAGGRCYGAGVPIHAAPSAAAD